MTRFEIINGDAALIVRADWNRFYGEYYVKNLPALQKGQMKKLAKRIQHEVNDDLDIAAVRDVYRYLTEDIPREMEPWLKDAETQEEHYRTLYLDTAYGTKEADIAYANLQTARADLEMARKRIKRLPVLIGVWKEVFVDELQ